MLRMLAFVCLSMLQVKELQTGIALMQHTKVKDSDTIEINLLGTPEITTANGSISQGVYKSQKGWRILVYLLLHRSAAVSAKELVANIWSDENDDTEPESIRGIVYRFKQKISFLSDEDLIISSANGYQINPACSIVTDLEQMEKIWESSVPNMGSLHKAEELKRALRLYRGDLFEDASHEDWLLGLSSRYHLLYLKIAAALFETLQNMKDYTDIHDYALEVLKIDRGNVETNYWLIYALKKLGAVEQSRRVFLAAREIMSSEEYMDLEARLAEAVGESDIEM
ncbi:MAG: winged helix-turn-helix domain-containing protein [Eubacteriales bacterium]|nr:winged helix-turn-helix domain-containing protein [Eubacteriales bacterium]